ncbi:MAG: tandem-95 repeat protein [Gammaproteobacteria bacterium]|nr:tandem-95 repeat protein [Gammaproteobacteria bacterium]
MSHLYRTLMKGVGIVSLALLSLSTWAAVTVTPSTSYTGSYTVTWPAGQTLFENNVSTGNSSGSLSVSGKAIGSYTYLPKEWNSQDNVWEPKPPSGTATVSAPVAPAKPTLPTDDTDGTFRVNWNTVSYATSYEIQEVASGGSTWSTVATPTTNYYDRTVVDGVWHYRVRACSSLGCGTYSAISNAIYVARTPGVPGTPTILPLTSTTGEHTVDWSAASGSVSKYELFRSSNGGDYGEVYDGASSSQPFSAVASGNHTFYVRACNVVGGFPACSANSGTSDVAVVNLPPVAVLDATSTDEDTPITYNVIANDVDPESNSLTITNVTTPAHGTVSHDAATITFTPAPDNNDNVSVTYTITDGPSTDTGVFNITVNAINDPPVAESDFGNTLEDIAVIVDVLANDTDIDMDSLSVSAITHGTNGTVTNNTSNVTYTLNNGFDGIDSFTYTVDDGNGGTAVGNASLTVTTTTINDDDGNYTVSWGAATGQVDTYKLEESSGGAWTEIQDSSALSKVFTNRPVGAYDYRVRACNSSGCGDYNPVNTVVCNYPVPSQVTGLSGPAGSSTGNVPLTWDAPTGPLVWHEVEQIKAVQVSTYDTASSNLTYSVLGLNENGEYQFRVRACNFNDCGAYSDPITTVVSLASTTSSVPTPTDPEDIPEGHLGSVFKGVLPGDHNVSGSGAASYTLPIAVPAGTNGMQPSLSLSYSSQNRNGLVGYGWSLNGVGSAIRRCPHTIAQNGSVQAVEYSNNDLFCFGGQQLVVSGSHTYGADNAEYRTELDGFNEIISHGATSSGPDWFEVKAKNGLIMEFGNSGANPDGVIEATGRDEAALWLLKRVQDRNGNYYTVTYEKDTDINNNFNGDYRPKHIDYTGNDTASFIITPYARVEFEYQTRSDVITRYHAGSQLKQSQRLSNIKTFVDLDKDEDFVGIEENGVYHEQVHNYVLSYGEIDSTDFPRLSSIELCVPKDDGETELCTEPTSFEWVAEQSAYILSSWTGQAPVSGALQKWADMNGDGKMDYVTTNGTNHYISLVDVAGTAYDSVGTWTAHAKGSSDFETLTDLNGDGVADYVTIDSDGKHYWSISNGVDGYLGTGGFEEYDTGLAVLTSDEQQFIDLDGDSLPDYLLASGTTYTARLNNRAGYQGNLPWTGGPDLGAPGVQRHSFHDVNKDGRTDLVTINGTAHSVYINNGSGFDAPQNWVAHASSDASGFWVDLNGDGLTDYVTIDSTNSALHHVSLSTGAGYAIEDEPWGANTLDAGRVPDFRDINGDGLTDYITPDVNGDHKVSLSNGRDGYDNVTWSNGHAFGSSNVYDFVDLDGDGKPDFVSVNIDGTQNVAINRCQPMHLMTEVDNGLSVITKFDYKPLTDANVYTKGTSAVYPEMDVVNPTHVVEQMRHSDGVGGELVANYQYEGFMRHRWGRGSLGFAKVTVIDEDRNTTTIAEYEQTWPKTSLVKHTEVWLTDVDANSNNDPDRLLSEGDTTYSAYPSAFPFGALTQFVAVDTVTNKVYDPDDGVHLSTSSNTNSSPDGYGFSAVTTATVTDIEDDNTEYKTVTTRTPEPNNVTDWLIARVQDVTTHNEIFRDSQTEMDTGKDRKTAFSYDSLGRLWTTTIEPGKGSEHQELTSTLAYDVYGNRVSETIDGPSLTAPRLESVEYHNNEQKPWHRFPYKITNAEGHFQTQIYDDRLGVLLTRTGPNLLDTTQEYDEFGRLTKQINPDSTESTVNYYKLTTPVNNEAIYIESASTGNTPLRVFYDGQGRELRSRVKGFDGRFIETLTEYDDKGRLKRNSQPYYDVANEVIYWNTPSYDAVNRVVGVVAADITEDLTTDYDGFNVTQTDNIQRQVTRISNAIGQVVEMLDPLMAGASNRNRTTYEYDIAGNLTKVRTGVIDSSTFDTEVTSFYDRLGRVEYRTDPNTGTVNYYYNALGEITEQNTEELRDNSDTVLFQYDLIGRITQRTEPETAGGDVTLVTTWSYDYWDNGNNKGRGRLREEKLTRTDGSNPSTTPFIRTSSHSSADFGRLTDSVTTIDNGTPYTTSYNYDGNGRLHQVIYPTSPSYPTTGFTAEYFYNIRGYLETVHEVNLASAPIFQATDVDAEGRLLGQYLGDGSLTTQGYAGGSGRLLYSNASRHNGGSPQNIQNQSYQYDQVGNIRSRSDLLKTLTETFQYDGLDRLTEAKIGINTAVTYAYNAMGNLNTKSDLGTFTYPLVSDPRPHAVTGVSFNAGAGGGSETYTYDENGNQTSSIHTNNDVRNITWTSFDKPASITKVGGASRSFTYGPDGARYKQVHSDGTTTHYVDDGQYVKKENTNLSLETHELTVFANGQAVAVIVDKPGGGTPVKETKYLHRDHLGSITAVTDVDMGTLTIESLSYDAFGKRRNATTWVGANAGIPSLDRGYTGHEHLDDVDIIHMNGRIYDPNLGRMLSPDPIVQTPLNSQNWNRYSYVVNNPLKFTDPSGYMRFGLSVGYVAIGGDLASFTFFARPSDIFLETRNVFGIFANNGRGAPACASLGCSLLQAILIGDIAKLPPRQPVSPGGDEGGSGGGDGNDGTGDTETDMNAVTPGDLPNTPVPPGTPIDHGGVAPSPIPSSTLNGMMSAGSFTPGSSGDLANQIFNPLACWPFCDFGEASFAAFEIVTYPIVVFKVLKAGKIEKARQKAAEAKRAADLKKAEKARKDAQLKQNKIDGDALRDEIAEAMRKEGFDVKTEVTKKTPFGRRVTDVEVSKDGKILGGIETKKGKSPYKPSQRAKDEYLKRLGYPVNVIRKP